MARKSNFELLRIVALGMVIMIHVSVHPMSGIPLNNVNWQAASLMGHLGRPAVDIFVLIGSFFLIDLERYDIRIWKRTWRILYPLSIFSIVLISYLLYIREVNIDLFEYLKVLINGKPTYLGPINIGNLWFIYPYIILIMISPILNAAINSFNRRMLGYSCLVLVFFFVILPSINSYFGIIYVINLVNTVLLFITLYFCAGYLKKFDVKINTWVCLAGFFICGVIGSFLTWYVTCQSFPIDEGWRGFNRNFFLDGGILVFFAAIFLFLTFKNLNFSNRVVNFLGKSTYEGYLIQNLVIFIILEQINYVQYFQSDLSTFIWITIGVIISTLFISLMYGSLRMLMDKAIIKIYKKIAKHRSNDVTN